MSPAFTDRFARKQGALQGAPQPKCQTSTSATLLRVKKNNSDFRLELKAGTGITPVLNTAPCLVVHLVLTLLSD